MSVISVLGHRVKAGVLGLALLGVAAALAAAPSWFGRMNYQGQLTDGAGEPVSDGAYSVDFRIYNSDAGGVPLWVENQNVNVIKGLFNVVLGTVNPLNGLAFDDDLWIALEVDGDGEMTPRQQLLTAPYSFNTRRLDGQPAGTSPFNIVQLDGTGKIPAGLVSGGSVSLPLDMTGNGGAYNLRVNNTGSGIAISATTASGSVPAIYGEAPRYPAYFKTNNDSTGIAVQAASLNGYASLVDRPNNAQVYGLATIAGTVGVLGANTNASGTGVAGSGGNIGVSGTGGAYGVYGFSPNSVGVYGTGFYGLYGATAQNFAGARGILGQYTGPAAAEAIRGENTSTAAGSRGIAGLHTPATGAGVGVYGQSSANTANAVGVQGVATGTTAQVYGVRGDISSSSALAAAVYGRATGNGSRAMRAESAAVTGGVGLEATASGTNSTGVMANGVRVGLSAWATQAGGYGVSSEGQYGVYASTFESGGAAVFAYSESSGSPSVHAYTYEGAPAILAEADPVAVSGTAYTTGIYGLAYNPAGVGGRFIASDASGVNTGVWASTNSSNGFAGRFTGGSRAIVADGVQIGVSATGSSYGVYAQTQSGTAIRGISSNWMGAEFSGQGTGAQVSVGGDYSNGLNIYANGTTSSWALYATTGSTTQGRGAHITGNCATCYGAWIENTVATGATAGTALYVNGGVFMGSVAGKVNALVGSTFVDIPNNQINANSVIIVTARSIPSPSTVRWYLSSVGAGTARLSFTAALTGAMTFHYLVIGD